MIFSLHHVPRRRVSPSDFGGLVLGLVLFSFVSTSLADVDPVSSTEDIVEPALEEPGVVSDDVGHTTEGDEADSRKRKIADETTRIYLNDLSARRRVTTLFLNRQSMLHGVQENFVNTSTGNLTFLVRDMVRVGGMPIVFGRVYDSSLRDNADFGPGWKLTVDERIVAQGSLLLYTDASNVTHKLNTSGNDITPTVAAWTPIRTGQIRAGGNVIALESNDLVRRRFKRMGDTYRLVAASHSQGAVRLTYERGLLATISSEHGSVKLTRRADGRIISARDDLGRTITYEYDDANRLTTIIDLGGESWEHLYANASGELAAITDPRGMRPLKASYQDGRVTNVQVLGRETRFAHNGTTTEATDVLGRTTVFHQSMLGITEGITDSSGSFTQLTFDDQYRPTKITRDGGSATHLDYDEQGRLASIDRPDGESATYTYSRRGLVAVSGGETARYRYSEGRVVHAEDASGIRTYKYNNGVLNAMSMNGEAIQFDTNDMGIVTKITKEGERLMDYAHDSQGRVVTIGFGHGDRSAMATYKYNQRGFREVADYSYGVKSRMNYDVVGNLIHYAVDSPNGKTVSQDYEIGLHNEVLRIQNGGIDDPDVSFRYDEAGRVYDIRAGNRSANVEYDNLDRAKRVVLDGETLLEYDYGNLETDAVAKKDALSGEVWTAAGTSGVFGTMDSIVFSRSRPLEFGPVAYEPALKALYVETGHLAPDAVLLSSLARRMVPFTEETVNGAPFGQDKPSNSLFIPPEYRSVNCYVCSRWASGLQIETSKALLDMPTDISMSFRGSCSLSDSIIGGEGGPSGSNPFLKSLWGHDINFGDGNSVTSSSFLNSVSVSHTYSSAGDYTISYDLSCSCGSLMTLASASKTISVGYPCNHSGVDAFVTAEMHRYLMPKYGSERSTFTSSQRTEPFERGVALGCRLGEVYVSSRSDSNPYRNNRVPDDYDSSLNIYTPSNVVRRGINTCQIRITLNDDTIAMVHSHPYFHDRHQFDASYDSSSQKDPSDRGGCNGGTAAHSYSSVQRLIDSYNGGGYNFSDTDKRSAEYHQLPSYILTPYGYLRLYTNQRNIHTEENAELTIGPVWEERDISDPPTSTRVRIPSTPTIPSVPPLFPSSER